MYHRRQAKDYGLKIYNMILRFFIIKYIEGANSCFGQLKVGVCYRRKRSVLMKHRLSAGLVSPCGE